MAAISGLDAAAGRIRILEASLQNPEAGNLISRIQIVESKVLDITNKTSGPALQQINDAFAKLGFRKSSLENLISPLFQNIDEKLAEINIMKSQLSELSTKFREIEMFKSSLDATFNADETVTISTTMDSLETAIEILANQITQHNFCIDQILEQYESLIQGISDEFMDLDWRLRVLEQRTN